MLITRICLQSARYCFVTAPGLSARRQPEPEPRDSAVRLCAHLPADGLDQLLDDGEADAGTTARRVARFLDAVEALENMAEVARGNSRTGVGHRNQDGVALLLRANPHGARGRRVAGRVLQEVRDDLRQRVRICAGGQPSG